MERRDFSNPLPLTGLRVTDNFWKKEMEVVGTEVITY